MEVVVLKSQNGDWEGIFVAGDLIDEGHTLGEGDSFMYMLKQSEKYNFKSKDVYICELNDEDDNRLMDYGNFPPKLSEMAGNYPEC